MRVACFGEVLLRLSAPGHERLFQSGALDASFGGAEANVAVSCANFGMDTRLVTRLPLGDVGDACVRFLRSFGVDVSHVTRGEGRMGVYYLERGAAQRPSKVIYDRAESAFSHASAGELDWDRILDGVGWFHWTGITPALSESSAALTLKACRLARERGIVVSCDLNYRRKLWSKERAHQVMGQLMEYVDVCFANEEDAACVLGIQASGADVERGIVDAGRYLPVAERISDQFGCGHVTVTLRESHSASRNGWSGLLYDAATRSMAVSRTYQLEIVDRVGGGDAFAAGIIFGLANGLGEQGSVEFAAAASCLKHSIEGDVNRVSLDEVMALVGGKGSGRVQR